MTTVINGSSPSITFSDGSTQSKGISSVNPVFTGDASISGLTVGKGGGAVASNTAVGGSSLSANTTGSNNTSVGYTALNSVITGADNSAFGFQALKSNTGSNNTAHGSNALVFNTSGGNNTGIGYQALLSNTTASYNTAVGYQAGYSQTTSPYNTYLGYQSGYSATTGGGTGNNTFVGAGAGYLCTTANTSTILGSFNGNQGGLDIRTASGYIVLSDGYGNPKLYSDADGQWVMNGASGANPSLYWSRGVSKKWVMWNNNLNDNIYIQNGSFTNGVTMNTSSTSWSSASDSRLKNVTGTYENALADISQIEPIKFTWKSDTENKPQVGVIAQSVQKVVPEAVDLIALSQNDDTEYLTVRYTELIPLMIAAIQELKAELDATKAEVAALKAAA